jgi:hypothetical protein
MSRFLQRIINNINPAYSGNRDSNAKVSLLSNAETAAVEQLTPTQNCEKIIREFSAKDQKGKLGGLTELAQQLKYLPKDKSPGQKCAEVINKVNVTVDNPVSKAFIDGTLQRRMKAVNSETTLYHTPPHKKTFDFLMEKLQPARDMDRLETHPLLPRGNIKKQEQEFAPTADMVKARKAYAPVWKDMWANAGILKRDRQDKMLDAFTAYFTDFSAEPRTKDKELSMPKHPLRSTYLFRSRLTAGVALDPQKLQSEKKELVAAFGAAFAKLVIALPDLANPDSPHDVSFQQKRAILLLVGLTEDMQPEQLEGMRDALSATSGALGTLHPLSVALEHLQETVKKRIAENGQHTGAA